VDKEAFYADARHDLTGPLAGVKVLEITTTWAGPMGGAVLADLGADVIKVEIPSGDVARALMPMPVSDVALMHATVNRNKRSLAIDMTTADGRRIIGDLAAQTDIVIENFRPGTLARYGLAYDDLKEVKPDIVYVSVTGFGQFGPDHESAGYDPLAQATSGYMTVNGSPDGPPTKSGSFLADDLGGLQAAIGAMAALHHHNQTGEGQYVDIALVDSMIFQTNGLATLGALGVETDRWGNEFGFAAPSKVFECADGPVYLGVLLDSHWKSLAAIIDQPELADNEAFAERDSRVMNRDVCNTLVEAWAIEQPRDAVVAALREAGLPVARVQTFIEVAQDEHVLERDMLQPTEQHDGKTVPIVGPAPKFSRTPTRVRTAAPALGAHNDEILEALGIDAAERQRLVDDGVLGTG